MHVGASEVTWVDIGTFVVSCFAAVGTVGSVIVSLWLASRSGRQEREAVTRSWALELLDVLAAAQRVLPRIRAASIVSRGGRSLEGEEVAAVLDRVSDSQRAALPLMPSGLQERWAHLRTLLIEMSTAWPEKEPSADPAAWTTVNFGRAQQDVEAYIDYVRDSLVALVDGRKLHPAVEPPHLRRPSMEVWSPNAEGG